MHIIVRDMALRDANQDGCRSRITVMSIEIFVLTRKGKSPDYNHDPIYGGS